MFYNILNQPYLPLDLWLDMKKFDSIVDDIILAVAKSSYAQGPTYPGPGYLDKSKKTIYEIYREIVSDPLHPYYEMLKNLKNWEPYNFVKYKWPGHSLGQCLVLRSSGLGSYSDKANSDKCIDYPIKENFKVFLNWLDEQNIFSSIGRIIVFLNESNTSVLEHCDYPDGISRKDQFVWISPLSNKSFYVRDNEQKYYMNSRVCYFDNANIHGSDLLPDPTFSIRVDGLFSENFKLKTSLNKHLDD